MITKDTEEFELGKEFGLQEHSGNYILAAVIHPDTGYEAMLDASDAAKCTLRHVWQDYELHDKLLASRCTSEIDSGLIVGRADRPLCSLSFLAEIWRL